MNSSYVIIYVDGKHVYEHRHLMEQHIGRRLIGNEVVHHKNRNKRDNKIENLELLGKLEHDRLNPTIFKPGHRDNDPRIAALRYKMQQLQAQGLSIRKIAAKVGLHHGTVQHYLKRRRRKDEKRRQKAISVVRVNPGPATYED